MRPFNPVEKVKQDPFRNGGAEPVLGKKSLEYLARAIKLISLEFILEKNGECCSAI